MGWKAIKKENALKEEAAQVSEFTQPLEATVEDNTKGKNEVPKEVENLEPHSEPKEEQKEEVKLEPVTEEVKKPAKKKKAEA